MTSEETRGAIGTALERMGKVREFREELTTTFRPEIERALVGRIDPDHFIEVAISAYLGDDKLRDANPVSVLAALRKCAQLGLRPDNEEACIVVYKGIAQAQPMFKGIVRNILRTKLVKVVEARVVHSADAFDYEYGLDSYLKHKPSRGGNRGEVTDSYALAKLANGERIFEVVEADELEKIHQLAVRKNGGVDTPAWRNFPGEMRRKIAVRRLSKYLELDPHAAAVVRYDELLDAGQDPEPGELIPEAEWRSLDDRVRDRVDGQTDRMEQRVAEKEEETNGADPLARAVEFGKHKGTTWRALIASEAGLAYVKQFVLQSAKHKSLTGRLRAALTDEVARCEATGEGAAEPEAAPPEPEPGAREASSVGSIDSVHAEAAAYAKALGLPYEEREVLDLMRAESNLDRLIHMRGELGERLRAKRGQAPPAPVHVQRTTRGGGMAHTTVRPGHDPERVGGGQP
jgi:phage RecT family recombinase